MSDYLELSIVKKHLRVLHSRDDDYIRLLIKAALSHIETFIDRPLSEVVKDEALPDDLTVAALLTIADMYENRASQTETNLNANQAVRRYMLPYRKMGV